MYLVNDTLSLSEQVLNSSMRAFLLKHFPPDYIEFVPSHWLDQSQPHRGFQIYTAIMFLLISITGNVCQIMVLLAYARYDGNRCIQRHINYNNRFNYQIILTKFMISF